MRIQNLPNPIGLGSKKAESANLCSALEKKIFHGACVFFVSEVISGGHLGHLGLLCLALVTKR